MKQCLFVLWVGGLLAFQSVLSAAPASLRVLAQNAYLPGLPVLVRVEGYAPDGSRERETWDIDATLTADGGVTLSTNKITLRNGMGSLLVTFTGGADFNLTATVGAVSVTRALQSVAGQSVTEVGGILSGGSGTWSGIINVTSDVIVTNYSLTLQSNTLVLLNGVGSGTVGVDLFVNANGSIQSLGTEQHPVTITCSNVFFTNRWGQIRHNASLPSLYRHTFIHRAGRAVGEGHTGQAAAIRTSGSALTFESTTISDLCETAAASPNFGTPCKVMFAVNSALTFNDCLFQRVRTGPEIDGTALLLTNSYVLETRGPDDSDGLYVHAQQAGQTVKITGCVFGLGDDDGIDTLGPVMSIENSLFREWNNVNEDAKGISVFSGTTDVRHCLMTDCTVAISAKTTAGVPVRVNVNNSTFMGNLTNVLAAYKANAPGPVVEYRITNSVLWGGNPVHSDFQPLSSNSTNFIIRYCDLAETWTGAGNIQSDPLFVNAAAKSFRVQDSSTVINAGDPASPPDADGTRADMGYFPFLTNASPLIAFGAVWRFLDTGVDQGANWQARLFNDSSWSSGPAQLGYSSSPAELDEATVVGYGPDAANKYITTYFRRAFTVLNPSEFTNLEARLLFDDGAVVYLNGQEAYRANMPGGAIAFGTLSSASVENTLATNSISPALLVAGTNVLAVEIHQQSLGSSDISFDFQLAGQRAVVTPPGNQLPIVNITAPTDGAGYTTPANIAIAASATDNDGTVTNVSFFQNGALLWATNAGPFNFRWNGVGVGSYALTAVATDNTGATNVSSPVTVNVTVPSSLITNVLIAYSNVWKYLDNGTDQGTTWRANTFDDSSWAGGQGQFGYGDGDEFTVVNGGPAGARFTTTYFRRAFSVTNAAAFTNLAIRMIRDDGGLVYLNGLEVFRSPTIPAGTVLFNTLAIATGENDVDLVNFPASSLLLEGTNVLAVEIHQQSPGSSDVSFDLQLTGIRSAETNARPIVAISDPVNGSIYGTPANPTFTATATDPDGTVTSVAFYIDGVMAGDDAVPPFTFATNDLVVGSHTVQAVATDNVGQSATSSIVNLTVSTDVSPPFVIGTTPAPGSVTNLTSINLVFSKPVSGVNAGDLLIDGAPATGLVGSGSNYTLTFTQPAIGPVAITWAAAHGITDTFTPAHDFDTNSAGANWSYQMLDAVPPALAGVVPTPGATVAALTNIAITFSEFVTGVDAADLRINGVAAAGVSGAGDGPYVFTFPQPALGVVSVAWDDGHGIADTSGNAFPSTPWSYSLNTNSAGIVISEIMHHPSTHNVLEEYIELFNTTAGGVDLDGWRLGAGVSFTFSNASIAAGGYLIVAADKTAFTNKYPTVTNVVGNWTGSLKNSGEEVRLDDAGGNRVDSVSYATEGDWARRQRGVLDLSYRGWVWYQPHDGLGASLEVVNPNVANDSGQNWAASFTTNGTPGRINSVDTNNVAPLILGVTHFPVVPKSTDPVTITARPLDELAGGVAVSLRWRVDSAAPPAFTTNAMHDDGMNGDAVAGDGLWSHQIPAQANNAVIEFYVSATDSGGRARTWPGPALASADGGAGPVGQVVNALFQIDNTVYSPTNAQPLYKMIMTANEEAELQNLACLGGSIHPSSDAEMNGTFVSVDGGGTELRYLMGFRRRGHGSRCTDPRNYHLNFRSDEPWKGVSALNLNTVSVHAQHLGSVLARKAGVTGADTIAVQVRVNNANRATSGSPMFGSYAANEMQNSEFAQNHFPNDPDGNVYRAIRDLNGNFDYRGEGTNAYRTTYYKESNASVDEWADLIGMLRVMGTGNITPFTAANARAVVNVEQWMRHLALMNLLGNQESGLNTGYNDDYFMYAGVNDPRFVLTFYDLDSILGEGGALPSNSGLFTSTNANGSGPAFARFLNEPEFTPIYYQALYDMLQTTFAPSSFNATVDQTLGGYVTVGTLNSIKNYMAARRAFVLSQLPAFTVSNAPTATLTGAPRSPTPVDSATLTVGGATVVAYRFSLNGGAYEAETPVGTPISLSGLPGGTNTVAVIAKGANDVWQSALNATRLSWVVNNAWPAVRLNEVLARNVAALNHHGTFPDIVELYNEGAATIDLGGLRLSNNRDVPGKFTFPYGTTLAPGSNLVVFANAVDGTPGFHLGFNLDADGDSVRLFAAATNGGVELDSVQFGRQLADFSIARLGNDGDWKLAQPSFGAANIAQTLGGQGSLRVNELLAVSQSQEDFVELYNPGALPVALGGLSLTDNLIGWPGRNVIEPLAFIAGNEFRAFIANGNGNGGDHLNFSLGLEQGEVGLFDASLAAIDCVIYGPQRPDVAQGRCPNGGYSWATLGTATPGAPNNCAFVPPSAVTTTLLTISNVWSFTAHTNLDGLNWMTNSFSDAAWPVGPGLLGQYTPTRAQTLPELIRTVIVTNPALPTCYARAHFNIAPGASYTTLQFRHIVDDGAAFYLNGMEIPGSRFNLAAGPITAATMTPAATADGAYSSFISIPVSMLVTGDNVFAVEVHQNTTTSSDSAMGVELQALIVTNSPAVAAVVINEVFANNANFAEPDGGKPDWLELYNPSINAVDLGDMSLTDDTVVSRRWVFPTGTILGAGGFLKVRCDSGLPAATTNTGFGLKANGGSVFLFNRIADGGSLRSFVAYGLQAVDFSIGRVPNGSSNWVLNVPSLGGNNIAAALGNASLLKINEWMASPSSGGDWFEIYNPNPQPVEISLCHLTDVLATPALHQVPALSFIGVGEDAFQKFIADGNTVAGADHVSFSLKAGGEALGLASSNNIPIHSLSFGPQAAGVSEGWLPDGNSAAARVSFPATSTPTKPNFLPLASIVVNELIAHTDAPIEDAVEFHNSGPTNIDIGGWYLSDSQNNLLKYRIPSNTVITAGGYVAFYEHEFNNDLQAYPFSFSSSKGDEVYLAQSTNNGTVTGYRAFATFDASANGVSFGRFPTSLGHDFTAMSAHTFGMDAPVTMNQFRTGTGLTNAYPKVGPVVINEIMYHPPGTNDALEFLELRNITAAPVPLYDTNNPANTWHLRKGIDFNFAPGTSLPANGYLVVVSFDPVADPVSLALFHATNGTNMTVVGPYAGKLDNNGEAIELQKPDAPQTVPGPDFGLAPYIVADRVVYGDAAPWPVSPDGSGAALAKTTATLYGNEPLNWQGAPSTPGAPNFAGSNSAPVLAAIADRSVHAGYAVTFTNAATDPEQPAQSLTFSIDAPVPSGATVGSSSGVFNWTPGANQIANHTITLRVTDNGAPALSDTTIFTVAVLPPPGVGSVEITNGTVNLVWPSHAGRRYKVFTTLSLAPPVTWVQVDGDVIAPGLSTTLTIPSGGTNAQRFHRIQSFDN